MKRILGYAVAALVFGQAAAIGTAQEAGKLLAPAPAPEVTAAPTPEQARLWGNASSQPAGRFFAEVGLGVYWMQGSGSSAPLLGGNATVGATNSRGTGFSASWQEMSKSSTWTGLRR